MGKPDADPPEVPWFPSEPSEREPRISRAEAWSERNGERAGGAFSQTSPLQASPLQASPLQASPSQTPLALALSAAAFEIAARACEAAVQRASSSGRVRAWVPVCRTGEVTYVIAMLLLEAAARARVPPKVVVFGTDSDEEALAAARSGRYRREAALGLDRALRGRYLFDEEDSTRVSEALRKTCIFSQHDLARDPLMGRMDLLVCNNIFEHVPAGRRIVLDRTLYLTLREGGLLLPLDTADEFPEEYFDHGPDGYLRVRFPRWRAADRRAGGGTASRSPAAHWLPRGQDAGSLASNVATLGLPLVVCDHQLCVAFASLEAQAFLGIASEGRPLEELGFRLPGGAELVAAARRALHDGETNELQLRHGSRHYLVRIAAASTGVSLLFTDVTALEAATAHALAQHHQQVAIARLSELGGTSQHVIELYDEALGMLFGNIPACSQALIIELRGAAEIEVAASRGLVVDPLTALREDEPMARCVAAVLERSIGTQGVPVDVGESDARVGSWRSAVVRGEPVFTSSGVVCPVMEGGALLAVLVAFVPRAASNVTRYASFIESVGHVLAGAVSRQRTRRALALELEASTALAAANGIQDAAERLTRIIGPALEAESVELWESDAEAAHEWSRVFPCGERSDAGGSPLEHSRGASGVELIESVARGRRELHVLVPGPSRRRALRLLRGRPVSHDSALVHSLERIARTLAEFLERERIRELSREKGAELEAVYASLPVGISIHDRDGAIRRVNRQLETAGVLREGAGDASNSIKRLYAEHIPAWVARVLATGRPEHDVELTIDAIDGSRSWLCNFAPMRDTDGALRGATAVVQDITERKRAELALRDADQQKDDFLALLGHELRNPIAAIRNATELLGRIEAPPPQLARLQSIFDRQTAHTTRLIDGLLDVSRIARGKVELKLESVQLVALVRQAVEDRREQFARRSLELVLPEQPLWIEADHARVLQVIDNLISNALKFTSATGRICIQMGGDHQHGTLRIEDDGIGIEPELLPHIFEPFRQGRARGKHSGGLGLGLALVKGLAQYMNFEIHAASRGPGLGASFTLRFPLVSEPEVWSAPVSSDVRGLELLLVEDNPDVAETLSELLSGAGHNIEVAGSGERAIEILRGRRPQVVLCDIGLPGMDGLELAERLRADPSLSGVKLVAMTGFGDASTRHRIEKAGFDRLLLKPVQFEALSRCLSRLSAPPTPASQSVIGSGVCPETS